MAAKGLLLISGLLIEWSEVGSDQLEDEASAGGSM